jgi:hypothetical protein
MLLDATLSFKALNVSVKRTGLRRRFMQATN